MSTVILGQGGELTLPDDVLRRCGLVPEQPVRLVETRGGLLLVPLDAGPMAPDLSEELEAWQGLAADNWDALPPYDESEGG